EPAQRASGGVRFVVGILPRLLRVQSTQQHTGLYIRVGVVLGIRPLGEDPRQIVEDHHTLLAERIGQTRGMAARDQRRRPARMRRQLTVDVVVRRTTGLHDERSLVRFDVQDDRIDEIPRHVPHQPDAVEPALYPFPLLRAEPVGVPVAHSANSSSPRPMSARTSVTETGSPGFVPAGTGAVAVTTGAAIWIAARSPPLRSSITVALILDPTRGIMSAASTRLIVPESRREARWPDSCISPGSCDSDSRAHTGTFSPRETARQIASDQRSTSRRRGAVAWAYG